MDPGTRWCRGTRWAPGTRLGRDCGGAACHMCMYSRLPMILGAYAWDSSASTFCCRLASFFCSYTAALVHSLSTNFFWQSISNHQANNIIKPPRPVYTWARSHIYIYTCTHIYTSYIYMSILIKANICLILQYIYRIAFTGVNHIDCLLITC